MVHPRGAVGKNAVLLVVVFCLLSVAGVLGYRSWATASAESAQEESVKQANTTLLQLARQIGRDARYGRVGLLVVNPATLQEQPKLKVSGVVPDAAASDALRTMITQGAGSLAVVFEVTVGGG